MRLTFRYKINHRVTFKVNLFFLTEIYTTLVYLVGKESDCKRYNACLKACDVCHKMGVRKYSIHQSIRYAQSSHTSKKLHLKHMFILSLDVDSINENDSVANPDPTPRIASVHKSRFAEVVLVGCWMEAVYYCLLLRKR